MKRIGVISQSPRFVQKLRLILRGECEVEHIGETADISGYHIVFQDIDTTPARSGTLNIGGTADGLPYPFDHEDIIRAVRAAIETEDEEKLTLTEGDSGAVAHLGQKAIRLTDAEGRLLRALLERRGYVSRGELMHRVWNDECDSGIVNVYIHYLREKLEGDGRRIILSSRKEGYMIDERFRSEEEN